jgi:hypothetical protein
MVTTRTYLHLAGFLDHKPGCGRKEGHRHQRSVRAGRKAGCLEERLEWSASERPSSEKRHLYPLEGGNPIRVGCSSSLHKHRIDHSQDPLKVSRSHSLSPSSPRPRLRRSLEARLTRMGEALRLFRRPGALGASLDSRTLLPAPDSPEALSKPQGSNVLVANRLVATSS